MEKLKFVGMTFLAATLVLAACGSEEDSSEEEAASTVETEEAVEETEESTETEAVEVTEETEAVEKTEEVAEEPETTDEQLNPNIETESEGNVEIIYTNKEPGYIHEMDGFNVSIDEYQIVRVTDMNDNHAIAFNDETEGYVVTAQVTVDNTRDTMVIYNQNHRIQLSNEMDYISNEISRTFVREEHPKSEIETEVNAFAPGETVTGLISFILSNEEFESLSAVSPKYVIEGGAAEDASMQGSFKGNAVFDFIYEGEQGAEVAAGETFYADKLTTDNIADKEMILEEEIGETHAIDGVTITLEGVQYTDVIPTAGNEEIFRNFGDNDIVAISAKFNINNQTDDKVNIANLKSKIAVNNGEGNILAQYLAEPSYPIDIAAGESDEKIHVFTLTKDEFDTINEMELQFGPFVNDDGTEAFKGDSAAFPLPR